MKRTEHLTSITKIIKDLKKEVSDLEWEGNTSSADDLCKVLNGYHKLMEQGELYVPEF
jgi:hypothetical protein